MKHNPNNKQKCHIAMSSEDIVKNVVTWFRLQRISFAMRRFIWALFQQRHALKSNIYDLIVHVYGSYVFVGRKVKPTDRVNSRSMMFKIAFNKFYHTFKILLLSQIKQNILFGKNSSPASRSGRTTLWNMSMGYSFEF